MSQDIIYAEFINLILIFCNLWEVNMLTGTASNPLLLFSRNYII